MADISDTFVHLRVRSAYSTLEGALRIKDLVKLCVKRGMPAVAVTDSGNLFGALEFSILAAELGVQPIIGCSLGIREGNAGAAPQLALLASSEQGYANLLKLVTDAHLYKEDDTPAVSIGSLGKHADGLICLTGGAHGPLGAEIVAGQPERAEAKLLTLREQFDDRLYVEIQRHGAKGGCTKAESTTEGRFLDLAYRMSLPIVATNDACFTGRDYFEAHQTLLAIGGPSQDNSDERRYTQEHYFKDSQEMRDLFDDLPEAIDSALDIARRCGFRPAPCEARLPRVADDEVERLKADAHSGLDTRLERFEPAASVDEYRERLDHEIEVIASMNFAGYFLIVAEFVNWAGEQGIPVGPGRGSGAGSLVAYALGITGLDPIRYGLLFERFLNPARISMPDFDIDFCEERRDEVIHHVRDLYGADRVAKIITFGSLQARAAIRDVARARGMPYGKFDRLAKLVPNNPANPVSLTEAYESEEEFHREIDGDHEARSAYAIASRLEGLYRNVSQHAAGIVIGDRPLVETVPLYRDRRQEIPSVQFSMQWAEAAGLVKFDFLGLKTLTIIQQTINMLAESDIVIDLADIPLDDEKTFDLYCRADTMGVFQVESEGMRDALRQLLPDRFEDIIALVALYRPGPMENIPKYCNIKAGRADPDEIHPKVADVLRETYGIIVYQEQVMEIARTLAGFDLGHADLLRRAMGKKKSKEMQAQRERFIEGAHENSGMDRSEANKVFDLVARFADYGFNKSHAAAYALVSYQTAYLKANYPVEFLGAVMNFELHGQDKKLAVYREDARRLGIEVPAPCVNRSGSIFRPLDGSLPYAMAALKGVGKRAVEPIEECRPEGGYETLGDFARRVDLREVGKGALECLARAGAFDSIHPNRREVVESVPALMRYSEGWQHENAASDNSLFADDPLEAAEPKLAVVEDYSPAERFEEERRTVGFLISGHPLDVDRDSLMARNIRFLSELRDEVAGGGTKDCAGFIVSVDERRSQKGKRYARLLVSDPNGSETVMVFERELKRRSAALQPGEKVLLSVEVQEDNRGRSVLCRDVAALPVAAGHSSPQTESRRAKAKASPSRPQHHHEGAASAQRTADSVERERRVSGNSAPSFASRKADGFLSPALEKSGAGISGEPAAACLEIHIESKNALPKLMQEMKEASGSESDSTQVKLLLDHPETSGLVEMILPGCYRMPFAERKRIQGLEGVKRVRYRTGGIAA